MRRAPLIPEFQRKVRRPRAGFIPGRFNDSETEVWQVWCHDANGEKDARRATTADMRAAGYVRRKR